MDDLVTGGRRPVGVMDPGQKLTPDKTYMSIRPLDIKLYFKCLFLNGTMCPHELTINTPSIQIQYWYENVP